MFTAIIGLVLIVVLATNTAVSEHKSHDLKLQQKLQQQSHTIKQLNKENAKLRDEKKAKAHFSLNGVRVENLSQGEH